MREIKKARFDVGASKQAIETGTDWTPIPVSYHNTAKAHGQIKISDFLGAGREAAVNMTHLANITGKDRRTIRLIIEAERRQGVPILSDNQSGYYMPADEDDIARFVQSMKHRANEILHTASAVEKGPQGGAQ